MTMDRRSLLGAVAGAGLLASAPARGAAASPTRIPLWPGVPPGAPAAMPVELIKEWGSDPAIPDRAMKGIASPYLEYFAPERPNGAAMMVIPGGAYEWVGIEKEGRDIAGWLAEHGYAAFVLFYRLPGEGWANRENVPLADAQRAIRLIRAHAADYGISAERVGVMGFSAGGHLTADLAARFAVKTYERVDSADAQSARPFLAAPIYPVVSLFAPYVHAGSRDNLLGPNPSDALLAAHSPDRNIPADAPPHFIVHADEDFVPTENSVLLHNALRARKIPVELHIFREGGHGFAMRGIAGKPVGGWPFMFLAFANSMKLPRP